MHRVFKTELNVGMLGVGCISKPNLP